MRTLVERAPGRTPEKDVSVTRLYNGLVMAAAEPSFLPQPGKIDRDFKRVGAMMKDSRVSALVTNSVVTALAATHGPAEADFFYQLDPTIDRLTALNRELSERMRQPVSTIGVIIDALDHTRLRGQSDPHALERAKQVLSAYGEAMTFYNPHLRDNREVRQATTDSTSDRLDAILRDFAKGTQGKSSGSMVVDNAHVHQKDPGDTTTYKIRKLQAPQPELISYEGFERDGVTATVDVLTPEGNPLEYSMTLLVKTDAGEWRPVHLAEPVTGDAYNPTHHLEVQQSHIWTIDLPQTKGKYAVVVESTPWHVDRDRKEDGSIYASLEQGEDADGRATRFLINTARTMEVSLSSLFSRDGAHDNEVRISPFGAKDLLNKLRTYDFTKALELPVSRAYKGRATLDRTSLSFSARVGVPGNEGTVPLAVLVEGDRGQELFFSGQKDDEVDRNQKSIKATADERSDRNAIYDILGADEGRTEIYFFDTVQTHSQVSEHQRGLSTMTATRVATREIGLAPLTRLESQGSAGSSRVTIEAAPFLNSKRVSLPIEHEMPPVTLEELLSDASEPFFAGQTTPQVRIVSPQIIEALEEEERIREESRRKIMESFSGWGSREVTRGVFGASAGYSTLFREVQLRGDAEVGRADIVGSLPPIEIAVTAELPDVFIPERIKNRTRRRSLQ